MKIAVTGASGHVGANLVRALLAQGHQVRVLVREDTRALEGLQVERATGDVRDVEAMKKCFEGMDVVYHSAALISIVGPQGGLVHATNVDGARNAARACREARVGRMVHFASIHAFQQEPRDEPLDETRPLVEPGGLAYDTSKAGGIQAVREEVAQGLDAVIVCPTSVIGPHDYKRSRLGLTLNGLASGGMPGLVAGGFDWVDVRDVVAGALAACEKGRTGEAYLLSGAWRSVQDLAVEVEKVSGRAAPRLVFPTWMVLLGAPFARAWAAATGTEPLFTSEAMHALEHGNRKISHEKATRELGYTARPLHETVRDTLQWQRETGWWKG